VPDALSLVLALAVIALLALVAWLARKTIALSSASGADLRNENDRLERELRSAIAAAASETRLESSARVGQLQTALLAQVAQLASAQGAQLATFGQQVGQIGEGQQQNARAQREESALALRNFASGLQQQGAELARQIQTQLAEVRQTLETRLSALQAGNEARLEQMRATVEEKLQTTLEARLSESFRQVSERLEQVHRGLGEMQALAIGVGDLKRVLTNTRARGMFGEVQLATLLEQILRPEQYAKNVATRPDSSERVEFAVKMPGQGAGLFDAAPLWLPIDAKFPIEDYERLLLALERADAPAAETAAGALEARIRLEARRIRDKYVEVPHTTEFAILFLPTESLYAEVLRRPGLAATVQRDLRIVISGPSTLAAFLNSLQMGFRTLALERRSAEVWQVLGAVKTEFNRFGNVLETLRSQLHTATRTLDKAETRTRQMDRALKDVESLPQEHAARLLPPADDPG